MLLCAVVYIMQTLGNIYFMFNYLKWKNTINCGMCKSLGTPGLKYKFYQFFFFEDPVAFFLFTIVNTYLL